MCRKETYYLFIFSFLIEGTLYAPPTVDRSLIQRDYPPFRSIAMHILKSEPEGFYIPVGRSPTFVSAILSSLFPEQTSNLPFSLRLPYSTGRRQMMLGDPLPDSVREEVYAHLDRFLPSESKLGDRPIVLIDFVRRIDGPPSVTHVYRIIEDYLRSKGRMTKLVLYAMGEARALNQARSAGIPNLITYKIVSYRGPTIGVTEGFYFEAYDKYSEYPSYIPGVSRDEMIPEPVWKQFVDAVRYEIDRDKTQGMVKLRANRFGCVGRLEAIK